MSVTDLAISNITAINNIGTTPIPVIASNSTRAGITFHNPGQNSIVVFPSFVLAQVSVAGRIVGQSVPLKPSLTALGGGFLIGYGATLFIGPPTAQQAWQALSLNGSGNPLTIQEQA
jgi:hypothetical protein